MQGAHIVFSTLFEPRRQWQFCGSSGADHCPHHSQVHTMKGTTAHTWSCISCKSKNCWNLMKACRLVAMVGVSSVQVIASCQPLRRSVTCVLCILHNRRHEERSNHSANSKVVACSSQLCINLTSIRKTPSILCHVDGQGLGRNKDCHGMYVSGQPLIMPEDGT